MAALCLHYIDQHQSDPTRKKLLMFKFVTPLFGLFVLGIAPVLAKDAAEPTTTQRIFDITRDGTKIGTNIIDIEKNGETTTVKTTNHISVVVMFFEAYHLDAKAVETWTKGRFVSYKSSGDDNGTKHNLTAAVDKHKLVMTFDGKRRTLPRLILPGTLWNKDFVKATELFDPEKGKILSINVKDLGDDTIEMDGAAVHAHHYKITGDLARDIWFEGNVPVRVKLYGPDHSLILSDLRRES